MKKVYIKGFFQGRAINYNQFLATPLKYVHCTFRT